jgi:cytochrome c-type biogenesis protein CcmH/NrfF
LHENGRTVRCLIVIAAVAALGSAPAPPDIDNESYEHATRAILCDCGCHPQSIRDCACGRADELGRHIAGMIRDGMSGEQVIADFVERKGEQIRVAPLATGFNLVAWLGPTVLFLAGAVGLVFVLRRWRRTALLEADASSAAPASPAVDPDDPYLARLQKDLERYP